MIRHAFRWLFYALGLVLLLVIGALAWLQTGPGKRMLAAQLSSQLSTPESGFEVADIEGWLPLDMRIGSLALTDRDGVWLKADGLALDWSPSMLLSGRLHVSEIAAETIELLRLPISNDAPEPVSDEPFRLPELPSSLPPVTLERLAVPTILLGPTILGEPASLAIEGSIKAPDSGDMVTVALAVDRTDKRTAAAKLEATAGLDPPVLDLSLSASESGGMIATLIDRPDLGDVTLRLMGDGPLDGWSGRLEADAGGLAKADAALGLALTDQPRLTVTGAIEPGPGALPDDLAALIGEQLQIDLDVIQTRAQALDLQKVVLGTRLADLEAKGSVDFDKGGLTLESHLTAPDLAMLTTIAKTPLSGSADARLDVTGSLDAPQGELKLHLEKPGFDDKEAASVATTIRLATTTSLSSEHPAFDVVIDGEALGLSIPGAVLPDADLGWNGTLAIPLEGEIGIDGITIETAGSSLTATGAIDPVKGEGAIDLTLNAPSIKRLAEPYGQPMDGNALIKAAVQLADQAQSIGVDLDASLVDLDGLPPGAAELFGQNASLNAKVTLDPSRTLNVDKIAIDGTHVALDGNVQLKLDEQDIAGRLNAALPDLTVLGALVPDGTKGGVTLQADLGGSLETPSVDLRLDGQELVLAGEPVTALAVTVNGEDLIAEPNGKLQIDVTTRAMPTTLALGYRLAGNQLDLDAIDLTAPETAIQGALTVMLDTTLVNGALEGRIANLGALEPWAQQKLDGSVDILATLTPDSDRQQADIAIQGRTIGGDFGTLRTLDVEASVADATKQPMIDAKATLTGFEQGTTKIDALNLTASGNDGALDLTFSTAGEVLKPLELTGSAAARFGDSLTLGVESLEGRFAGEPLRLQSPFAFQQEGDAIMLSGLDLRLGDASLTGDIEIGDSTAEGKLALKSVPLRWSELFDGPAMTGDAEATIDLSGSVTNPTVVAALKVDGQLAEDVASVALPLDIALNATLDQGRLAADVQGNGLAKKPIEASVSLPAELSLRPFSFEMPENGEIDGDVSAEVLLARIADLLALDDQTLKGTLFADIALGGTIADPKIDGPIRLEGGGYENGATGTDIRDLVLTIIASNERVEITELAGNTGKKRGTLASSGWLELDAEADFPLSVTLTLDDARLVNRDDVDGRISGDITLSGDLSDAEIKGDLKVERAEIQIPDGGGPNLPEIEVTEIGGRFVNPIEEDGAAEEAKPFDPTLDVSIEIPKKVYVRGRGLESEWEGELDVSGVASNPIITGDLSIRKGYFDFLDKRFTLEQGEITFSGSTPPNPTIALEARAEDDDFTAIINLSGQADDPQLLLSSEPTLPDDEVLARLLFNRELSEIGPVEAAKLALAANKLRSSGGGFDAFGEIRNILKIDTLDVVSDEDGESKVRAGKYLADDVYVEVERGAGDESGRARVEIEVLPNIAIEAETSENADAGVGVKWKLDY